MTTNRPYLNLIQHSVKNDGVSFEEIVPNYLYRAILGEKSFLMHDVEVGLNNSAAAKTAMSKSGTYETLKYYDIPAIEHAFLMNTSSRFSKNDSFELAKQLFSQWNKKVVVKQDNGSQGNNVYKVTSIEELIKCLKLLFQLGVNASISPYEEATYEYRIVTLASKPKLFLGKQRTTSWKHNLISGAIAIDIPDEQAPQLATLANKAASALELDFCTVDILQTSRGLHVLEINEQVMLDEYCKNNPDRQRKVADVYREAVLRRFKKI
ncbi:hypothetical protein H1D32_18890 [Anaerobacillus sp. CMMVII]|uniref:ATP-grasp domain-containing protein n=1 Tax=Anaerobacillus sp. CMMVII TaxID=2755588 RepID=UPI0021B734AD|nr:hypothetical protein [Anaerobacillus sp. CMMVII]MCT8139587.1 hypothetical protein [Anaerobacillus sp. CMMVII]